MSATITGTTTRTAKVSCLPTDDTLRFESVSAADHSRAWNYNDLQSFEKEQDNALVKITGKNGDNYHFKTVNGNTAGGVYDIVSRKIVAARPGQSKRD